MIKRMLAVLLVFALLFVPVRAADLQVSAASAVLMDLATGTVIYAQNAHERLAPASVTKVMTLLLIMEAIDSGRITRQDRVTASETAAAKGGSQVYLKVGEVMTVDEMLKSITVSSANDCACAMAEYLAGSESAFVEQMNEKARLLGMADTHFVNCTGLDDGENAAEHLTSAYDIALMSRELLLNHPDIRDYTTIWMDTVRGGAFGLANTNKLVRFYEGTTGLKTGYTSSAGHCLSASAMRDGLELIAVVLRCPSSSARFQSAKALLDYGFANYALADTLEEALPPVPVVLGEQDAVQPVLEGQEQLLIDKGKKNALTRKIDLPESLDAPIEAGEQIGTLTLQAGDTVVAQLPIVAGETVPKLSYGQIIRKILQIAAFGG